MLARHGLENPAQLLFFQIFRVAREHSNRTCIKLRDLTTRSGDVLGI